MSERGKEEEAPSFGKEEEAPSFGKEEEAPSFIPDPSLFPSPSKVPGQRESGSRRQALLHLSLGAPLQGGDRPGWDAGVSGGDIRGRHQPVEETIWFRREHK